jgi:hypothetical protein
MPEFRKWFIVLAAVVLFAGLASAQVGGQPGAGGTTGSAFTCGVTNGAVTPTLRAEGYTELAGDIVIVCSGGVAPPLGSVIPTANITLFLNTAVTSRLLSTTSGSTTVNASEALLLVDEPGSGLNGYGPSVPQTVCGNPNFGAGVSVVPVSPPTCTEVVGVVGGNIGVPTAGVPVGNGTFTPGATPGANVFQGVTSGNQVTFFGIPVMPPATAGDTRVFRITNVRVNANGITAGGATPGSVTASLSINSASSIAITNSTLTVGFVEQGLSATNSGLRNTANSGAASSSGASFAQCTSASITSTTNSSGALGVLQFSENFATAFKIRQNGNQNVPGAIYNSESGFIESLITGSVSSTGSQEIAGLADYGTRLKAVFNNVPSGVSLYVTTRDVTNDFNPSNAVGYNVAQAVLVVSETAGDGGLGNGPSAAAQSTTFGLVPSIGLAPVAIGAGGVGTAVWEVVNTNPSALDTIDFGLFAAFTASAATNSPAPGSFSVTLSYAPTPSSGAFTSTTGAAASSSLGIPRFSDSLDITKTVATVNLCTTAMLFPYVINVSGFDTGIAIANTTTDPFGTAAQSGSCSLYFYGTAAPTTEPFVSPVVATGTVWPTLASTVAPGFSGYMIANCNFQYAHGFAFVSDVGARNLAMGYLALIFFNSTNLSRNGLSSAEQLNN